MKKWEITLVEKVYYEPTIIEAETEKEARREFLKRLNAGKLQVRDTMSDVYDVVGVNRE